MGQTDRVDGMSEWSGECVDGRFVLSECIDGRIVLIEVMGMKCSGWVKGLMEWTMKRFMGWIDL